MAIDITHYQDLLTEKNYVACYLGLQREKDSADKDRLVGLLISKIVDELGESSSKGKKEQAIYLRSTLAWIFKDIPEMYHIYKSQIRLASDRNDPLNNFVKGVQNFSDMASGKKSFQEGVEDAVTDVKESIENSDVGEHINDIFGNLQEGFRKGVESLNKALDPESDDSDSDSRS